MVGDQTFKPGWCSILALLVKFTRCLVLYIVIVLQGYTQISNVLFASSSVILNFGEAKVLLGEIFATQAVSLKVWQPMKPFVPGMQHRSPEFKSDQSTFCLGNY